MAKHKYNQLLSRLLREIVKISETLTSQSLRWLLRYYFVANRWRQDQAGFVLPTVAMMLMVVALVVGALMFRTFSRTNQVIQMKQELLNANSAYPAIERGKAKLEYLFNDERLQSGVPDESVLEALLLNDGSVGKKSPDQNSEPEKILNPNPYQFPDEEQINLDIAFSPNEDIKKTTAWKFKTDKNGNGKTDDPEDLTTIYAIVSRAERNNVSIDPEAPDKDSAIAYIENDKQKVDNFLVRNGPLVSLTGNTKGACAVKVAGNPVGWFNPEGGSSSAFVYKTFQIYAITVPNSSLTSGSDSGKALATLQYQQDRAFERGNKWGAWFRYDLEIAPGPSFNWNGAMHTQGNMFLRGNDGFRSYLISSPNSCFFKIPENSSLSLRLDKDVEGDETSGRGGQFVSGMLRTNSYVNTQVRIDPFTENPSAGNTILLTQETDSVNGGTPMDVSTDPLALHTQGVSKPKNAGNWSKDTKWEEESNPLKQRVSQKGSCAPYVDDTYRADDRFGPKPNYSRETFDKKTGKCVGASETGAIGQDITQSIVGSAQRVEELTANDPPSNDKEGEKVGLDGYWERRARFNGLRLIVGQRLELGNPFGWNLNRDGSAEPAPNGNDRDLYPLQSPIPTGTLPTSTDNIPAWAGTARGNEARQYITLRDNLAAVQATAVYHYVNEKGYFPVAFVATTAHPGTAKTLEDSTKFEQISFVPAGTGTTAVSRTITDFFYGKGTNGWEFNVVPGPTGTPQTETAFKSAIASSQPLGRALWNLAHFAGDPDGSFPPKQETSGTTVHPYPNLTMWGNFSNLRSTISRLKAGTSYDKLSIADKSNLHTAAGTLGMLAYSINYLQEYDYANNNGTGADQLLDELNTVLGSCNLPSSLAANKESPADVCISYLEEHVGDVLDGVTVNQNLVNLARLVALKEQVERDRLNGFKAQDGSCAFPAGLGNLKLKLCPKEPKFPSLFYLFPKKEHNHKGTNPGAVDQTATSETYVTDPYISDPSTGVNKSYNYQVLLDTNGDGQENTGENGIAAIALQPRTPTTDAGQRCTGNYWCLPTVATSGADPAPANQITDKITTPTANAPNVGVPFLDKAIFDGRQMMSVRVLDMDLNIIRQNSLKKDTSEDTWLPKSAIVYAFREDAVREDGIARPAANSAATMNVWTPTDPQMVNGISPKPVDFFADPDRRPYGFRLRNGLDLRRLPQVTNPKDKKYNEYSGLSFVSDNPVYIQGDFNPHSTNATVNPTDNLLEEFTEKLKTDYSNFYTRPELNPSFARPATDTWRPAEIISDAVTILSNTFCDGNIQGGIRGSNSGCAEKIISSYRNGHMKGDPSTLDPTAGTEGYICENPFDRRKATLAGTSTPVADPNGKGCDGPIKVFRNGEIKYKTAGGIVASYTNYREFKDNRDLNIAGPGRVNAVIVSGIVPSRQNQSNGGMVNFPRFLESWDPTAYTTGGEQDLFFSGSLMQLNFSTYATGPWDQDAWEPGNTPQNPEYFKYYWPPNRRWGYDVGLQYAPPGNVAKRMVLPADARSEFYREPKADDPYICKLRKYLIPSTNCGG